VLFQFVEFLITAYGADYAKLLPPLDTLCNTYQIRPDVAFHIWRPALHGPILVRVHKTLVYRSRSYYTAHQAHNIIISDTLLAKKAENAIQAKELAEAAEKRLKMALAAKRTSPQVSSPSAKPIPLPSDTTIAAAADVNDINGAALMDVDLPGLEGSPAVSDEVSVILIHPIG